jgi:Cupredoxin-like domain
LNSKPASSNRFGDNANDFFVTAPAIFPARCPAVGSVRDCFSFSERAPSAQNASIAIAVKDHRFQPAQLSGPANRPLSIRVKNLDSTAMEFESVSLRVEKVVAGGSEGVVNVRALAPGRYEFFDDFHQETRGVLVVQ